MQIFLISIGNKMPSWVNQAFQEYAKRMPTECRLKLLELPMAQRGKNADIKRLTAEEGKKLLKAIPKNALVVALDMQGRQHSTESLAEEMGSWLQSGRDIALLIGGPDGLDPACLNAAQQKWSLSKLTFPHPLVRVLLAEQLYRAWSLLNNHPYHRAG